MLEGEEKQNQQKSMQALFFEINRKYVGKCFCKMRELEIHPSQIPILAILGKNRNNEYSQKEIAQILGVKPPTVTVSIQRLEKMGMVCRKQDEHDRRITRIHLTDKGNEVIQKGLATMHETEKYLFSNFSETELCLMRRFFNQLLENIDAMPGTVEKGCPLPGEHTVVK
nr:MarR family transcriptional regulator [uncultured Blautia sp.]